MLQKPKTGPQVTLGRTVGSAAILKRIAGLGELAAYVGVPADESGRSGALNKLAGNATGKRAKKLRDLALKSAGSINNAELLFIHTNGSPLRKIPARPVLQPAIEADGNRQAIAAELESSIKASIAGNRELAVKRMRRVALTGQNAARKWFSDPRNSWAPNAPSTIKAKGSDRPLIDTGALRNAIVGVIKEE
jgi:hypothetical protein